MRELFWTPEAIQDRDDIYEYIEADNPAAAITLDELFARTAGRLLNHSALGKRGRVIGTRELVVHRNYVLVYDTSATTVRVLRVLHVARQWPPKSRG